MQSPLERAPLACPLDGLALAKTAHGLSCASGHSFDVASSGYASLLPVQLKASKEPGDSKAMVQARRRVMDAGVFRTLAKTVTGETSNCLKTTADATAKKQLTILDAGCGEGFYTDRIHSDTHKALAGVSVHTLGIDISKWAIQSAAKRYPDIAWAVGNNRALPITVGSADVITSVFGFETWSPWSEQQTPGQYVVTVDAGVDHLIELRELIYDDVTTHDVPENQDAVAAGYREIQRIPLSYRHEIEDAPLLKDIIDMTPHRFRSRSADAPLKISAPMSVTIAAVLRVYQR